MGEDSSGQKRRRLGRNWFQISLRGLLLATGLIALLLGWWSQRHGTGVPRHTGRDLDVAIFGQGYLTVLCSSSGEICYTRYGRLSIDPEGMLVAGRSVDGWRLEPEICIPGNWTSIEITNSGEVLVGQPGSTVAANVGQIELAKFVAPEGLRDFVPGILRETDASGPATVSSAGTEGLGLVMQGWLERSGRDTSGPVGSSVLSWGMVLILLWIVLEVRAQRREVRRLVQYMEAREELE